MAQGSVVLQVIFEVRSGREADFERELVQLVAETRREEGCLSFDPSRAADRPGVFLLHEEWARERDLDRHGTMPHVAAFKATFGELLAGPPIVRRWSGLA